MPDYVTNALGRFRHRLSRLTHSPSACVIRYGKSSQLPQKPPPNEPEIDDKENTFIQQVVGTFLYYGRAVNPTVLHALSAIACSRNSE